TCINLNKSNIMDKIVIIELNAEAKKLYSLNEPSQKSVDKECALRDNNNGKSPNGKIEDFISNVHLNKRVIWVGDTKDEGYTVSIDSIVYLPNPNDPDDLDFFHTKNVSGTGGSTGIVTAIVKNDKRLVSKQDIYTVNFSIYENGLFPKCFHIDPKLAGNP
ncbi:MAG TPA: hypothetical protein VJU52_03035, partial [Flavobacterium sp.]|nr:hypothetical protein [Flavobacterium sp.]